jgi:uncharacterized protein
MGLFSISRVSIATLALAATWAVPSGAATFDNLYRVTVPPDPAAPNQREAAIQAAMARLLIRVTGSRNAPLDPTLQPLIGGAESLMTSYGLDLQGRNATVAFNGSRLERAVRDLGMRFWGGERPLTLLWVAVDDGVGGRTLLGANETAELGAVISPQMTELLAAVRAEIVAAADERGLPIAWPLLDAEDLSRVSFLDVWGRFEEVVLAASVRYRADAVLIGRVRPGTFGNEVEWLFVNGIERQQLPVAAIRDGLDAAADRFAGELGTVGGLNLTLLTVRNVSTARDYARVLSYLERQSVLESVDVESLSGGTLSLRVAARGDPTVLERVLALGGVLRPAAGVGAFGSLTFEIVEDGALR